MGPIHDWKHWHVGCFEGWTAECEVARSTLAAEVWLDHGEWNWTIYRGPAEFPGGTATSAEEAMDAVQRRLIDLNP